MTYNDRRSYASVGQQSDLIEESGAQNNERRPMFSKVFRSFRYEHVLDKRFCFNLRSVCEFSRILHDHLMVLVKRLFIP